MDKGRHYVVYSETYKLKRKGTITAPWSISAFISVGEEKEKTYAYEEEAIFDVGFKYKIIIAMKETF